VRSVLSDVKTMLDRRVVPDIARPAHRAGNAVIGHQPLELRECRLAALVRVVQQAVALAEMPNRHDQRIGYQLGAIDQLIHHPTTRRK
jgi:hypothetical protein